MQTGREGRQKVAFHIILELSPDMTQVDCQGDVCGGVPAQSGRS